MRALISLRAVKVRLPASRLFTILFNTPVALSPDHHFFRPEVELTSDNFLWLSAPKPIVAPGTPFTPYLQTWIRNANLSGRDIIYPNTWAIWI
jgi:hypothetical protein